jgi:hypothetical protein
MRDSLTAVGRQDIAKTPTQGSRGVALTTAQELQTARISVPHLCGNRNLWAGSAALEVLDRRCRLSAAVLAALPHAAVYRTGGWPAEVDGDAFTALSTRPARAHHPGTCTASRCTPPSALPPPNPTAPLAGASPTRPPGPVVGCQPALLTHPPLICSLLICAPRIVAGCLPAQSSWHARRRTRRC